MSNRWSEKDYGKNSENGRRICNIEQERDEKRLLKNKKQYG